MDNCKFCGAHHRMGANEYSCGTRHVLGIFTNTTVFDQSDVCRLTCQIRCLAQLAKQRLRITEALFRTLREWERVATHLPEGKSGHRLWTVTIDDVAHLEKWAKDLDDLAVEVLLPDNFEAMAPQQG